MQWRRDASRLYNIYQPVRIFSSSRFPTNGILSDLFGSPCWTPRRQMHAAKNVRTFAPPSSQGAKILDCFASLAMTRAHTQVRPYDRNDGTVRFGTVRGASPESWLLVPAILKSIHGACPAVLTPGSCYPEICLLNFVKSRKLACVFKILLSLRRDCL